MNNCASHNRSFACVQFHPEPCLPIVFKWVLNICLNIFTVQVSSHESFLPCHTPEENDIDMVCRLARGSTLLLPGKRLLSVPCFFLNLTKFQNNQCPKCLRLKSLQKNSPIKPWLTWFLPLHSAKSRDFFLWRSWIDLKCSSSTKITIPAVEPWDSGSSSFYFRLNFSSSRQFTPFWNSSFVCLRFLTKIKAGIIY